jgi:hypothetical protein
MERAVGSMNVTLSNLQQLRNAIASAWINIPLEKFRRLVESMARRITAVLEKKAAPIRYKMGVPNKLARSVYCLSINRSFRSRM